MKPIRARDLAPVVAFLAMAVEEEMVLNSHTAREAWDALMRLLDIPPAAGDKLLRRMLGDAAD